MKKQIALLFIVFSIAFLSSCSKVTTFESLDKYLLPDVPMIYTEFEIFPEKNKLNPDSVIQYKASSLSTLFFDDIYLFLCCSYSPQQYEQEVLRLKKSGAVYYDDLFNFPSYVMLFYDHYYEYALLDTENCTIVYVAAQISDFSRESYLEILNEFPPQYFPVNVPSVEICIYD